MDGNTKIASRNCWMNVSWTHGSLNGLSQEDNHEPGSE